MGTLTADVSLLPEHCPHKLPTSCRLTSTPLCCACYDRRPHSSTYRVYIDGVGFVFRGTRWQAYCWFCKTFWDNRVADSALEIPRTKIPETPDQTEWLERWYEWHKGQRVVKRADGTEETVTLMGESLKEVAPGKLPRTMNELREDRFGFRERPTTQRPRIPAEEESPVPAGPSLDQTLDELLAEAETEEAAARTAPTHPNVTTVRWNALNNRLEQTTDWTSPDRVMSDVEVLNERIREAKEYLELARQRHERLTEQLEDADTEVRAKHERVRRLERDKRRMENFARVFGTREEIERQGDAYESPIGGMFNRAMGRYRQAEEARQQAHELGEHLERMDVPANVGIGGIWGDQLQVTLQNTAHERPQLPPEEMQAGFTHQLHRPEPDYPNSQLLHDQLAIIRQLSGDSARIRSELSAIRQLSSNAAPTSTPTAAPSSASASAVTPNTTSASTASLEAIRSQQRRMTNLIDSQFTDPNLTTTQADATLRLISHLRSTTAEAEALVSAINSFGRIRETTLAAPNDQPLGLDVESDRPEPKAEEEMTAKLACRVCYTQIADTALMPCGHLALCKWCADMAVPGRPNDWTQPQRGVMARCPVCREKVKKRVRIYAVTQD